MNYKTRLIKLKLSRGEIKVLQFLTNISKRVYNTGLANIKKYYQEKNKILSYFDNCKLLKNIELASFLNAEIFQRTLNRVSASIESYFKLKNLGLNPKFPDFLKNKYYPLMFSYLGIKKINNKKYFKIPLSITCKEIFRLLPDFNCIKDLGLNPNTLDIPESYFLTFSLPKDIENKKIKEVSIIPTYNGRRFDMSITYIDDTIYEIVKGRDVLAIDFGVNNLMTCTTTKGESFIVDGKRIKSMNQYFNKKISYLNKYNNYVLHKTLINNEIQYVKIKREELKPNESYKIIKTKRMIRLIEKHENKIQDYIYKSCNFVLSYCMNNNISTVVIGYNKTFQTGSFDSTSKKVNRQNNQKFKSIPFGKIKNRLEYILKLHNIKVVIQEESYTSKASFFDGDYIPLYGENSIHNFSGTRVKRGLYKTASGKCINADVNGSLNILTKSNVCDKSIIDNLRHRGVSTPMRYTIL